jgi:hypothetical protein
MFRELDWFLPSGIPHLRMGEHPAPKTCSILENWMIHEVHKSCNTKEFHAEFISVLSYCRYI